VWRILIKQVIMSTNSNNKTLNARLLASITATVGKRKYQIVENITTTMGLITMAELKLFLL
jgi:hypothetical protein